MQSSPFTNCLLLLATFFPVLAHPERNSQPISLNLTTILTHYSIISSSSQLPEASNSTKKAAHHHPFCISTTLSTCPANSLCIKHRCHCRLGYRLNLDGQCVVHKCANSHDCTKYFPHTFCSIPAQKCICEADYLLEPTSQKCLFNGPAAEQRKFWSMVVTGSMLCTVFIFCCLICRAKAVGGDNERTAVDNCDNGSSQQRRRIRGSHVPPPPSSSLASLSDSPPDYYESFKNFPPPPPPYSP